MNRQRTVWSVALSMVAGVTLASLPFVADAASQEKHLEAEYSVNANTQVEFDSGVGSIKFERAEGDVLQVRIRAYKDDDAFFDKKGNVEDAELNVRQMGNRLILEVSGQDGIQLDWVVKVPKVARIETDLGVGEISGELWVADMNIDIGVGEVDLVIHGDYATIKTDVGVGDSKIRGPGSIENNRFLMTANSRATSAGTARISVDAGVGDINLNIQ